MEFNISEEVLQKWQTIVDIIADLLEVPSALIVKAELPEVEVLRSADHQANPYRAGERVKASGHYCESVIKKSEKVSVSYAPKDPVWSTAPEIDDGMVAYLGYPIYSPDGKVFGTICVLDNKENVFGDRYDKILLKFKELIESNLSLLDMNEKLAKALNEVNVLRGMLPICCFCKKIRDDKGYWNKIEEYVSDHSEAEFTHSLCPECARKNYPQLYD